MLLSTTYCNEKKNSPRREQRAATELNGKYLKKTASPMTQTHKQHHGLWETHWVFVGAEDVQRRRIIFVQLREE
eukprot:m.14554 g.14554  ORF g.14554 m.14554 type:complete len:74 (+) comp10471_c0_seq1:417-638(+)